MPYAIIQHGSQQFRVENGMVISVDRMDGKPGDQVTFSQVLFYSDGEKTKIGTPYIPSASVSGTLKDHVRGKKIRIAKFKAKVRTRRLKGFRHDYSRVAITSISVS